MERLRRVHLCLAPSPAPAAAAVAEVNGRGLLAPHQRSSVASRQEGVPGTGWVAVRTSDPREALEALRRDGGCIFRVAPEAEAVKLSMYEQRELAADVPRMVFGDSLATRKLPARLAGGGWDGREWRGWRGCASVDRGHIPNKPHMDRGPYGLYSDYFCMVCFESPTKGDYVGVGGDGGSLLLDGYDIVDALPERDEMFTVATQNPGYEQKQIWRSPMCQWTTRGRLLLREPVDGHTDNGVAPPNPRRDAGRGRLNRDLEEPVPGEHWDTGRAMINHFREAVVKADLYAPRYVVGPGEALLIDNYRMLHGRDPFVGGRIMWRVMCWTDERMYEKLPDVCICGCGQEFGGSDRGKPVRDGGVYGLPVYNGPWHEDGKCGMTHNEWVTERTCGSVLHVTK